MDTGKRIKKRLKKVFGEKKGMSMVEVLVAFIIVMLMTAMFSRVVTASVRLLSQSRTTIERNEEFETEYYKTAEREKREPVYNTFTIAVDSKKTDVKNQSKDTSLTLSEGKLKKYVYTYKDETGRSTTRYSIGVDTSAEEKP